MQVTSTFLQSGLALAAMGEQAHLRHKLRTVMEREEEAERKERERADPDVIFSAATLRDLAQTAHAQGATYVDVEDAEVEDEDDSEDANDDAVNE